MSFFQNYVKALDDGDVDALVQLFSEDVKFRDWGGRLTGTANELVANGREELYKLYSRAFANGAPDVKLVKENPNSMEYDVVFGPRYITCVGCAAFNEEGLVFEYIVRPR